ncbi:Clp protease N-terminal domain-containing protein [Actinomycetospora lutea]|uniref:Clp protease N-terminal domain-containing protein n=1 Tax=Actinomycetospora lutea TaxID=663604 RepID=UPI0023662A7F|nr:Clp protease N-terminal domain-containing protein [Actinomycetospora lutea]MDD7938209.1 Clp protease N-terminal domain-containing protein [Actinomycetospora lutea]
MTIAARQTERVTRVFLLADQEAARGGDARVRTVHLLLALAREERDRGGGLGGGLLDPLDLDDVRAEAAIRFRGVGWTGRRPYSPGAVAALDAAVRVADESADPTLGVRHLLVAVLADDAEDAAQVLHACDVDVDRLRAGARRELTADTSPRPYAAAGPVLPQLDRILDTLGRIDRRLGTLEGRAAT